MAHPNIYHSPYPMPIIPTDQSVSQFLLKSNPDDIYPEKIILADFDDPDGANLTYATIRDIASRHAAVLRRTYGLKETDVVCIYGYNSLDWIKMAHAVLWAGGCFW